MTTDSRNGRVGLDVERLSRVLREHRPENRTARRLCICYEWEWRGNDKQYHAGWAAHIAAEYDRLSLQESSSDDR